MKAQFSVAGANCTWCLNDVVRALLARSLVTEVETHAIPGCIVVEHGGDDPATLQAVIDRILHGFETASNGEIIMTTTSATEESSWPNDRPAPRRANPLGELR